MTSAEAVHIITQAKPHLKKSGVALKDADRGKAAKEWRTSSQYFLPTAGDKLLERVDRRVQARARAQLGGAQFGAQLAGQFGLTAPHLRPSACST